MPKLISNPFQKVIAAVLALLTVFAFAWTVTPQADSQVAMQEAGTQAVVPDKAPQSVAKVVPAENGAASSADKLCALTARAWMPEAAPCAVEASAQQQMARVRRSPGLMPEKRRIASQVARYETQSVVPESIIQVQTVKIETQSVYPESAPLAQTAKIETQGVVPSSSIQTQLARLETQEFVPSSLMPSAIESI